MQVRTNPDYDAPLQMKEHHRALSDLCTLPKCTASVPPSRCNINEAVSRFTVADGIFLVVIKVFLNAKFAFVLGGAFLSVFFKLTHVFCTLNLCL